MSLVLSSSCSGVGLSYTSLCLVLVVSGACEFDESAVGRIVRCGEETDDIEHTDYNNDDGEDNIDTLQSLFYPVSLIEIDIPHDKFKKLKTIGEK